MPAQSAAIRIEWVNSSDRSAIFRDHQRDLDHAPQAICTYLVAMRGDEIDFETREMIAPISGAPNSRLVFIWLPVVLARDDWKRAISAVCRDFHLGSDPETWEFAEGPEDYNDWIQSCRTRGAK